MQTQNKQRFFAFCGIVAPIFFTLLVVVASLLRPGYIRFTILLMTSASAPYAIIQTLISLFSIFHPWVLLSDFVVVASSQLLIWRGLKSADDAVWGRYRTYSLVSGLLSIILLLVLRVAISTSGDYQGVAQRTFLQCRGYGLKLQR